MIAFSTCQRGRLKRPSSSSTAAGMWSSTTSILLLFLVLEVAAFQQNFGKIGKTFFCFYVLILLYSSHNTMGLEFDKKKVIFHFQNGRWNYFIIYSILQNNFQNSRNLSKNYLLKLCQINAEFLRQILVHCMLAAHRISNTLDSVIEKIVINFFPSLIILRIDVHVLFWPRSKRIMRWIWIMNRIHVY